MVLAQDPIASGFARSLAQPGGNITGLTVQGTDMQGKVMQILREAVPAASRVGILWLPSIAQAAWWGEAGGLLVYGVKDSDQYDRAAQYVAKILRGAKTANLPIQQPTRFELQINLKTAQALKLTIPKTVILQADKILE